MSRQFDTMNTDQLQQRLEQRSPNNSSASEGYALVNVLAPQAYDEEHIPGSINIPKGREDEFAERFDKEKEIVVYCASTDCQASPTVARRLTERGFSHVVDYQAGMSGWKDANGAVA